MKNPCKDCDYYHKENNTCQSKKCGGNSIGHISILDKLFANRINQRGELYYETDDL